MASPDPRPSSDEPRRFSARRWCKHALIFALLFGVVIAMQRMWESLSGPPFLMVIETDDGVPTVQFVQPGKSLISKSFRIDLDDHFEGRRVVMLDSPAATIPGGQIEFADTSLMPGRFKIRLGKTLFDVMPAGIHVDGQHFEWLRGDATQ